MPNYGVPGVPAGQYQRPYQAGPQSMPPAQSGGGGGGSWYSNPNNWMAIAGLAGAGASLYGAYNQNQIQGANFAAQQAHQQQLLQMINQNMQQGQNPYAAQLQSMIGQMRPPGFAPQQGQPGGQGQGQGQLGGGRPPFGPPQGIGAYWDNNGMQQQALIQNAPPAYFDTVQGGQNVPLGMQAPPAYYAEGGGLQGPRPGQIIDETFGGGQIGGQPGGGFGGPQMYQYQNQNAFTYNPMQLGNAPQFNAPTIGMPQQQSIAQAQGINVANPESISIESLLTPQIDTPANIAAASMGAPSAVKPTSVNVGEGVTPGQLALPDMISGTQGANAGQDALLQMMRRDIGGSPDQFLRGQLQQIGQGDTQFDNSALFASMAPNDQRMLDEQVSQLKGSKGSFAKLFSSNTEKEEGRLRENFATNVNQRNMGIQQQSFEAAQNRRQGALGQLAGLEQFYGQMPLQNAQLQLQAAQAAGQLGNQGAGLNLQAQLANQGTQLAAGTTNAQLAQQAALANQGNQLNAGTTNAQLAMQAALANQNAGLQVGQQNAQLGQQASMFNTGNQLQAALAQAQLAMQGGMQNQQLDFQSQNVNAGNALQAALANQQVNAGLNQFNAGQMNQGNQFNQNMMAQLGMANASNQMQAGLANQNWAGQYAMQNQNAFNQAGQFNAGMGQQAYSNNAQQGNIYNQMLMGMMGQANQAQQAQQGMNNQLIGMFAGVGVPQQLPSAWPGAISDVASTAMMYPFLQQMMRGNR